MRIAQLLPTVLIASFASAAALPYQAQNYQYIAKRYVNESSSEVAIVTPLTDVTTSIEPEKLTSTYTDSNGNELTTTSTLTKTVVFTLSSSSLTSTSSSASASPSITPPPSTSAPVAATTSASSIAVDQLINNLQSLGKQANVADVQSALGTAILPTTCAANATVTITVTPSGCSIPPTDLASLSNVHKQAVTIFSTNVDTTTITIPVTATFTITNASKISVITASSMVETAYEQTHTITLTSTNTITEGTSYVTSTTTATSYSTVADSVIASASASTVAPEATVTSQRYTNGTVSDAGDDTVSNLMRRAFLW